jgi:transposase-like protein
MSFNIFAPHFQDADKAREYLEAQVWPHGPVCPHCASVAAHYEIKGKSARPGLYKCKDCRQPFTVTVGSVFESSKVPLHKWLLTVHLISASKKGISAHQLHRMLNVTYRTAWFMAHRVREAMKEQTWMTGGKLGGDGGPVEVDETYWGTSKEARETGKRPRGGANNKMKVVSLVERNGRKRSFAVPRVNG